MSNFLQPHGLYSLPGSSLHGNSQATMLEWVAISSPGDLPDPGIELTSLVSCLAGRFFTTEPPGLPSPSIHYLFNKYIEEGVRG